MPDLDDLRRAQRLARQLEGGRYIWGGAGRRGSDCSGFMSILLNSVQGRPDVFQRRFGTGNISANADRLGLRRGIGDAGDFNLGVRFPKESRSGIGHVAGTLGGLNVESRGHRGVLTGRAARGATNLLFLHHFHVPIDGSQTGMLLRAPAPRLLRAYPGHMLKRNSGDHPSVRAIQRRLNEIAGPRGHGLLGGRGLVVTGEFDQNTEKVVKAFQQHRGMEVDGVVGPLTWARMFRRR
jgi:hypothetical protein